MKNYNLKRTMKKHKLEILMGLMIFFIISLSLFLRNKVIIIRTPILIRSEWPTEDNWADVKMEEMIMEILDEKEAVGELEATRGVNTHLVAIHSQKNPGVYGAIVRFFGKDSKIVGELVARESSMNPLAVNPTSGACGLFQSYPCEKMNCDLEDIDCQMEWGRDYIDDRYGTPENALAFWHRNGWY